MEYIFLTIPIIMFAGVVRGFSGFGFAAIAVVGLNFFMAPQQSIAIVLSLDCICSLNLWKKAVKQANFYMLKRLVFGSLFGIPLGYCFLLLIPAEILKLLICLSILGLSILLFCQYTPFNSERKVTQIGFGLASGAGTASASVGGPMIVYYMLSSHLNTCSQRATMILFFIVSELLALMTLISGGTVDNMLPKALSILIIPTILSVQFGQRLFNRKPPQSLKSFALPVMATVALLGIVNSTVALLN